MFCIGAAKIRIVVHDGDQSRRRRDVLPADGASRVPGHGVVDAGPAEEVAARRCRRVAAKVQAEGTPQTGKNAGLCFNWRIER